MSLLNAYPPDTDNCNQTEWANARTSVRTYVRTYARTFVRTNARTHVRTYIRMYACKYVRTYVRMNVRTCVCPIVGLSRRQSHLFRDKFIMSLSEAYGTKTDNVKQTDEQQTELEQVNIIELSNTNV